MRRLFPLACGIALMAPMAFAGVTISSPSDGATVSSPVHVVASASSSSAISYMQIYLDGGKVYTDPGSYLDTKISMSTGKHRLAVLAKDGAGNIQKKTIYVTVGSSTSCSPPSTSGVKICTPSDGASVGSSVTVAAAAKSSYAIKRMELWVDGSKKYTKYSYSFSTSVSLSSGSHRLAVVAVDSAGKVLKNAIEVKAGTTTISSGSTSSGSVKAFYKIEEMSGWDSCDKCAGYGGEGSTNVHSMSQGISSPSLDGKSAKFFLGGSTPYSNALWWKQLLYPRHYDQIKPVRHFIYDVYFYIKNPSASQAIEWDVNQYLDGKFYLFGTQCDYKDKKTFDVYDPVAWKWISTGVPCPVPTAYKWHHVVIEFQRTWDNQLRYISFTLNGNKHYINRYYKPRSTTFTAITVNYQMGGNKYQTDYNTWVDKLTLKYW